MCQFFLNTHSTRLKLFFKTCEGTARCTSFSSWALWDMFRNFVLCACITYMYVHIHLVRVTVQIELESAQVFVPAYRMKKNVQTYVPRTAYMSL
jgi:hypothetical protein